ncbi:hypothetical protein MRB53_003733 [Persea americana]|uniref:Uncharacterized protein n=1 Tax=Persea americana TaxID=3435 RepID=A0ACC2MY91_PERAE|nr:hypothetical protein MRB53_003733 [Persea americana]
MGREKDVAAAGPGRRQWPPSIQAGGEDGEGEKGRRERESSGGGRERKGKRGISCHPQPESVAAVGRSQPWR